MLRRSYNPAYRQQKRIKWKMANSPLASRGYNRGRKYYVTLALLVINNTKRAKVEVFQTKKNEIRNGCLTPTFSGAQRRARMLRHPYLDPCLLGVLQHGFQKFPYWASGKMPLTGVLEGSGQHYNQPCIKKKRKF